MIGLALSAVIAACDSFAISFPSALLAAEKEEEEEVANQRHLDYSRVLFSSSPSPRRELRPWRTFRRSGARRMRFSRISLGNLSSRALSSLPPLGIIKRARTRFVTSRMSVGTRE